MRPETSEALARLVSIYVTLIERAGYDISETNVARIHNDPFAACETLNELAVKFGALDAESDAVIAAIYESMDAADARSAADDACRAMAASAWETSHVERVVPEPEPEPEPQAEAEPAAADGAEPAAEEQADKPKRRRRTKAKQDQDAPEKEGDARDNKPTASAEADGEAEPVEAKEDEGEPATDNKPGRRSRAKAKEKAERKPKVPKAKTEKDDAPANEERKESAAPESLEEAAARHDAAALADSLSVDQAVAILGVSRPTVYKLIESGELPAYKKGRSWRISAEAVAKRAAN